MWPFKEKQEVEVDSEKVQSSTWELLMENPSGVSVIWVNNDGVSNQVTCEAVWESPLKYMMVWKDRRNYLNKEDVTSIEVK